MRKNHGLWIQKWIKREKRREWVRKWIKTDFTDREYSDEKSIKDEDDGQRKNYSPPLKFDFNLLVLHIKG